nr:synaptobrevin, longin-like domain protein [Tanacetum cinerariifolium]
MVAILEKTKHNIDFHQIVDFLEASHIRHALTIHPTCLSLKNTSFNEFSSNVATALVCLATNSTYNFFKMIFDGMMRNVKSKGKFLMYPRRITRGTIRIFWSKVPSPGADEIAFPTGDVRYREAFPTVPGLDVGQDMENIAKTSAMPHEALPKATSLSGGEGSMQQKLQELMDMCTSLGMDQGEDLLVGDTVKDSANSADKGSDSTDEMANVLGTLGATNILDNGGLRLVFTTASLSVATASTGVSPTVATASGSFLTAAILPPPALQHQLQE